MRPLLLPLLALPLLMGCSTTDDPNKGGFVSGLMGVSGAYDRRQQALDEKLQDEKDITTQKQRELERANAEKDATAAQRSVKEQKYAALQKDLAALRKRVKDAAAKDAQMRKEADRLNAEISDIEARARMAQRSPLSDQDNQKRLEQLQKEKAALERELDLAAGR